MQDAFTALGTPLSDHALHEIVSLYSKRIRASEDSQEPHLGVADMDMPHEAPSSMMEIRDLVSMLFPATIKIF